MYTMYSIVSVDTTTPTEWFYVPIEKNSSQEIRSRKSWPSKHWLGEIEVELIIGSMKWKTKLWWVRNLEQYIFLLKKELRTSLQLKVGDKIYFHMKVL
jgi:hypothetical protein